MGTQRQLEKRRVVEDDQAAQERRRGDQRMTAPAAGRGRLAPPGPLRGRQDHARPQARPLARLDHVELATLEWVAWFNHRRLHGYCQNLPPAEFEDLYHRQRALAGTLSQGEPSLH